MKSVVLFAILFAFIYADLPKDFRDCKTEQEAQQWLDQFEKAGSEPYDKTYVSIAMNRGWWNEAERLVLIAHNKKIDVSSSVYRTSSVIKNELKKIIDTLNSAGKEWPEISPAFQWTQSDKYVYLNVKFASRWDTPATLGCDTESYVLNDTHIDFRAKCPSTKKYFVLRFPFWRPVKPDNSSYTMAAVGRVTFNIMKSNEGNWGTLLKGKKPTNMHTWWAMEEQVDKEAKNTPKPPPPKPSTPTPTPTPTPTAKANETTINPTNNTINLNGTSGSFTLGSENMERISKEEFEKTIHKSESNDKKNSTENEL